MFINNGISCYEYSDVIERVSNVDRVPGYNKCYYMAQVGLDDTPRRGENGSCIVNDSPELFEEMMDRLFKRTIASQNEYIFINVYQTSKFLVVYWSFLYLIKSNHFKRQTLL